MSHGVNYITIPSIYCKRESVTIIQSWADLPERANGRIDSGRMADLVADTVDTADTVPAVVEPPTPLTRRYGAARMSRPGFRPPGSGRKKGTQNTLTKTLQDMVLGALADAGGQQYLRIQALSNPSAFLTLVGRVIPLQLKPATADPLVPIRRIVHEHRPSVTSHANGHTIDESTETLSKAVNS